MTGYYLAGRAPRRVRAASFRARHLPRARGLRHDSGVNAYTTEGWDSFFVAEAGAAAALAGLLFVAVSINLSRILSFPGLSGRAAEALLILFGVIVVASLGLVPGQSAFQLGLEILAVGALIYVYLLIMQLKAARHPGQQRSWIVTRILGTQLAMLPLIVAGVSTAAHAGGGLYWLAPGVVLSFGAALIDAWVLMVEIQR